MGLALQVNGLAALSLRSPGSYCGMSFARSANATPDVAGGVRGAEVVRVEGAAGADVGRVLQLRQPQRVDVVHELVHGLVDAVLDPVDRVDEVPLDLVRFFAVQRDLRVRRAHRDRPRHIPGDQRTRGKYFAGADGEQSGDRARERGLQHLAETELVGLLRSVVLLSGAFEVGGETDQVTTSLGHHFPRRHHIALQNGQTRVDLVVVFLEPEERRLRGRRAVPVPVAQLVISLPQFRFTVVRQWFAERAEVVDDRL
ncbi:hypothetical protein [Amycolatopsis taiwanensis]|uniref:Uncharacterized protein n=1 Tax=Amycolatopsis taiwanensis TaxID=342230 RepID=A0A9W6QWH3_9PSEU|nr:hypothetical protein [Amycolatopsis taiwanensis]GLY63931.1 hypothetical protein Atai01_05500 [Amycolatopsis taiwanensis]